MTINTETIRDAAEVLDTLTSTLAVDHPLRTQAAARAKSCVSGLYSAADALDVQTAEIARLRGLVAEMAEHDTYETEYDGRMYSICHGCGAQDGEPHRNPNCLYVRARAALSGESNAQG